MSTEASNALDGSLTGALPQMSLMVLRHILNVHGNVKAKVDPLEIEWSVKLKNVEQKFARYGDFEQRKIETQARRTRKFEKRMAQHIQEGALVRSSGVKVTGTGWSIQDQKPLQQSRAWSPPKKTTAQHNWNYLPPDDLKAQPETLKENGKKGKGKSKKSKQVEAQGSFQALSLTSSCSTPNVDGKITLKSLQNMQSKVQPKPKPLPKTLLKAEHVVIQKSAGQGSWQQEVYQVNSFSTRITFQIRRSQLNPLLLSGDVNGVAWDTVGNADNSYKVLHVTLHSSIKDMFDTDVKNFNKGSCSSNYGQQLVKYAQQLSERLYHVLASQLPVVLTWSPPDKDLIAISDVMTKEVSVEEFNGSILLGKNAAKKQISLELLPNIAWYEDIFKDGDGKGVALMEDIIQFHDDQQKTRNLNRSYWSYFLLDAQTPSYFYAPQLLQASPVYDHADSSNTVIDGWLNAPSQLQRNAAVNEIAIEERMLAMDNIFKLTQQQ